MDIRKSGVLSEGKNAVFDNCEMSGPDAGMIERGVNTTVKNSKITATGNGGKKWWEQTWVQIIMLIGAAASIVSIYFILR